MEIPLLAWTICPGPSTADAEDGPFPSRLQLPHLLGTLISLPSLLLQVEPSQVFQDLCFLQVDHINPPLPHSIPLGHDSPELNAQNWIRDFGWSPRDEQHAGEDLTAHLAGETPAYTSQDMVCLFHSTVTLLICMTPSHLTPKLWPCWLIQPLRRTWHFSLQNSPFFKHFSGASYPYGLSLFSLWQHSLNSKYYNPFYSII